MTAQASDSLIMNGEHVFLQGCLALPWHHPRLKEISEDVAREESPGVFWSSCWRRYIARWRIEQNRLYLEGIDGIYELEDGEPLFADWVTETLTIGCGGILEYVHMGFGSVYEEELLLDVRMGMIVGRAVRDNRGETHDRIGLALENMPTEDTLTPGWKRGKN